MDEQTAKQLVHTYGDMLYRICAVILRCHADAEDAVQETLLRLLTKAPAFADEEHRKAWLITVAVNQSRSLLRRRKRLIPTDPALLHPPDADAEDRRILEALMQVPDSFRIPLLLHYGEGYKVREIAGMIGKSSSAVKMRLSKGRRLLEEIYRKDYLEGSS